MIGLHTEPPPRRQPSRPGIWSRFWALLRDGQAWKELAYVAVCLPLGSILGMAAILYVALLFRAVTYPVVALVQHSYAQDWGGPTYAGAVAVHTGQGLVALFLAPLVFRWLTDAQGYLVRTLLGARPRRADAEGDDHSVPLRDDAVRAGGQS
jgi:hypothetical protein